MVLKCPVDTSVPGYAEVEGRLLRVSPNAWHATCSAWCIARRKAGLFCGGFTFRSAAFATASQRNTCVFRSCDLGEAQRNAAQRGEVVQRELMLGERRGLAAPGYFHPADKPGIYWSMVVADDSCTLTAGPTTSPTSSPTTSSPTQAPTTPAPTKRPSTLAPTKRPTVTPTKRPVPTKKPSKAPTKRPTSASPTKRPTRLPTVKTLKPTRRPTAKPTVPTRKPTTARPTTARPTLKATNSPSQAPTVRPTTLSPTGPTKRPTVPPPTTRAPTTTSPTTPNPTRFPTARPTTLSPTPKTPAPNSFRSPTNIPFNAPLDESLFREIVADPNLCMIVRPAIASQFVLFNNFFGTLEQCKKECQYDTGCKGLMFSPVEAKCYKMVRPELTDQADEITAYTRGKYVAFSRAGTIVGYFNDYCETFGARPQCVWDKECGWNEGQKGWNQIRMTTRGYCGRIACFPK